MSRLLKNKKILITQKYKTSIHEAIDLVGENYSLDYIISHSAGVVEKVRKDYKTNDISGNSYGNFVKIQHDNGYYTLYAHLKYGSVDVNVGDRVKKGSTIWYMGDTGHANGAHLHFEVRNENDIKIDPTPYIDSNFEDVNNQYTPGRYVVDMEVLTVRKNPYISPKDDNWLKFEELTKNAQEQVKSLLKDKNIPNGLVMGVICDVTKVFEEWGKIPSGWINLKYCKKI